MAELIGNEENMKKVQELMNKANQVNLGDKLTHGVPIDFTSAYNTTYKGTIVFKRPSMQDYMKMGTLKAQFLGSNGIVNPMLIDDTIRYMAQCMSTLMVVIEQAPSWLLDDKGNIDVSSIKEPDLLYHVYDKYEEWEENFRKPSVEELQGDSQASE